MGDEYKKYDVIWALWPIEDENGSVQYGYRPGVIIQNNIGNKYSPTLVAMSLTKNIKKLDQPTHTIIEPDNFNGLKCKSMLMAEQMRTFNKKDVTKIGEVVDRDIQIRIFLCYVHQAAWGDHDPDLQYLNELGVC